MSTLWCAQAGSTKAAHLRYGLPRIQGWVARAAALVASTVIVAGVSGCGQPASSISGAVTTAPAAAPASSGAGSAAIGSLPNLVGRGLQNAQDTAQAAGFDVLKSHDALGRGRHQISDREWKVCFQNPAPGPVPTTSPLDFGAVKLAESCPATDQAGAEPGPAGASMPNLIGKSVAVAEQSLGNDASISFKDATGADRTVLVRSNWLICAQDPAPGKPYNGVPVTLTVTKFTESC
jgi:hypothetical protein